MLVIIESYKDTSPARASRRVRVRAALCAIGTSLRHCRSGGDARRVGGAASRRAQWCNAGSLRVGLTRAQALFSTLHRRARRVFRCVVWLPGLRGVGARGRAHCARTLSCLFMCPPRLALRSGCCRRLRREALRGRRHARGGCLRCCVRCAVMPSGGWALRLDHSDSRADKATWTTRHSHPTVHVRCARAAAAAGARGREGGGGGSPSCRYCVVDTVLTVLCRQHGTVLCRQHGTLLCR